MPVIQGVELRRDTVLVLEALVEQQLGVKLELEVVAAQMLHVVLDHNLDCLLKLPVKSPLCICRA